MSRVTDLSDKQFGRLTPLSYFIRKGRAVWNCRCTCGNTCVVGATHLVSGGTVSCGCYKVDLQRELRITHGMWNTREHNIWKAMKDRCNNPNNITYHWYGGKGISYCEAWEDFSAFYADMGEAPEGHSIDRIDGNKGYYPENCRWATSKQQARNRDGLSLYKGRCLAEWAERKEMSHSTLSARINRLNWTWERALKTPVKGV